MAYRKKSKLMWWLTLAGVLFLGAKFSGDVKKWASKIPVVGSMLAEPEQTQETNENK